MNTSSCSAHSSRIPYFTAAGIKKNAQEGMIQSEVGLDDLFGEKV